MFATEQLNYNESQVRMLLSIVNNHKELRNKLEAYVESVQSTFVLLPRKEKSSKSRRAKDNRKKKLKRKVNLKPNRFILFLEDAISPDLKQQYFGSTNTEIEQLNYLPEPLSTNYSARATVIDMFKFDQLHYKRRAIIYNYVNERMGVY